MPRFWKKPMLRNHHHSVDEHRHVSWLELLYDLTFVVAIGVIGHQFAQEASFKSLLMFLALFLPVWWAWLGDAFYINRYDPEDHGHELSTFIQMLGIVGLAIFAQYGLENGFVGFALSYILVRIVLAFLYYRTGKYNPSTRELNYHDVQTILLSVACWIIAIFLEPPLRYWVIAIAMCIDFISPLASADQQIKVPMNARHISSRFGFFFIILIGEIISAVALSVDSVGVTFRELLIGFLGLALAFCFWWVYFENDNGPKVVRRFFSNDGKMLKRNLISGYVWVYAHLPLSIGLLAVAVGIERIVSLGPDASIEAVRIQMVTYGMAMVLTSIGAMQLAAAVHDAKNQLLEHFKLMLPFGTTILILLIPLLGLYHKPIGLLGLLAGVALSQVIIQEYIEHRLGHTHMHGHD